MDASIHMLFMWMDLTVVWINSTLRVVDVREARRWRSIYLPQQPAQYVLELPSENQVDFTVGDLVKFDYAEGA